MNVDGNQNVVDIIFLVQMLLGGEFENYTSTVPGIFKIDENGINTNISISSNYKRSSV